MTTRRDEISAVILAGGQSKRMGSNKALLPIGDITFIARITNTLQQRFSKIYISANNPEEYEVLKRPVITDIFRGYGPLAGIHAALKNIPTEHAFAVSCDVPFISTEVIDALVSAIVPGTILIADDGQRLHPLIGIYPRSVYNKLDEYLRNNEKQVHKFLDGMKHKRVDVSQHRDAVKNINTIEEYERIVRR